MKKIEQKMFTPLLFAYVIRCNKNKSKFIQIKEFVSSRHLHYDVLHVICLPLLSFALIGFFSYLAKILMEIIYTRYKLYKINDVVSWIKLAAGWYILKDFITSKLKLNIPKHWVFYNMLIKTKKKYCLKYEWSNWRDIRDVFKNSNLV